MPVPCNYFHVLAPNPIRLRPVFIHYKTILNLEISFKKNTCVTLSDDRHSLRTACGTWCRSCSSNCSEFELQKHVAELAIVTHELNITP